jgi:hypothetical protein
MFDPYGKVTICNPDGSEKTGVARVCSAFGNPFFFTGRRNDDETRWFDASKPAGKEWQQGLMQFRYRMYDVGLGRFFGRDPIGYADGMGLQGAYFVPGGLDSFGLALVAPLPFPIPKGQGRFNDGYGTNEEYMAGLRDFQLRAGVALKKACSRCIKPCGNCTVEQCEKEAVKIQIAIIRAWATHYGKGPTRYISKRQPTVGGWYCFQWARKFRIAVEPLLKNSKCWRDVEGEARTEAEAAVEGTVLIHAYLTLYVRGASERPECKVHFDDGFLEDGYVHEGDWPNQGERGYKHVGPLSVQSNQYPESDRRGDWSPTQP